MAVNSILKLQIPLLEDPLSFDILDVKSKMEQAGVEVAIESINWSDYPYLPFVRVRLGYSKSWLWLLYEVKRDFFRAKAIADQQAVWEDSCVEFFCTTDVDKNDPDRLNTECIYRNFEFNSLGICWSAIGTKEKRVLLPEDEMKQILRFPGITLENIPIEGSEFDWELGVAIPLDLLGLVSGSSFRANFYKCGDLTQRPHFLSWSGIESAVPDFHLPQFFGEAELAILA